jgi:hypothetical protein
MITAQIRRAKPYLAPLALKNRFQVETLGSHGSGFSGRTAGRPRRAWGWRSVQPRYADRSIHDCRFDRNHTVSWTEPSSRLRACAAASERAILPMPVQRQLDSVRFLQGVVRKRGLRPKRDLWYLPDRLRSASGTFVRPLHGESQWAGRHMRADHPIHQPSRIGIQYHTEPVRDARRVQHLGLTYSSQSGQDIIFLRISTAA